MEAHAAAARAPLLVARGRCTAGVRSARRVAARAPPVRAAAEPPAAASPAAQQLRRRDVLSIGTAAAAAVTLSAAPLPQPALAAAITVSPAAERAAAFLRFVADADRRGGAPLPDFPPGTWFNAPPLSLSRELRGRVLILDFWTLCCVNCMHVLPELAALEAKYASAPVTVVGVHSPKFSAEGDDDAIRAAVLRYGVTHPVLNDAAKVTWRALGVDSWPTLAVVAPTGRLITMLSGEGHQRDLDDLLAAALSYYGDKGLLVPGAVPSALERDKDARVLSSPLRRVLSGSARTQSFFHA
jgi:thiol-disulfide isomerase/thioredoxin